MMVDHELYMRQWCEVFSAKMKGPCLIAVSFMSLEPVSSV
jgi:hypothetical protein